VENVPLNSGTNVIILTVTDAAGNSATTNIAVTESPVNLSIDDVPTNVLNQPTVTVSGILSTSNYTVWVNGIQAANNGDGTWTAQFVPVNDNGTATFSALAVPNASTNNLDDGQAEKNEEKSSVVELNHYELFTKITAQSPYSLLFQTNSRVLNWDYDAGGTNVTRLYVPLERGGPYTLAKTSTWPTNGAEGSFVVLTEYPDHTNFFGSGTEPPPGIKEHCSPRTTVDGDVTYIRNAYAKIRLKTGGKATSTRKNLFVISGSAGEVTNPYYPDMAAGDPQSIPVDPTSITILGRQLDDEGNLCVALPDNQTFDVTPIAPPNFYTFSVDAAKYELVLKFRNPKMAASFMDWKAIDPLYPAITARLGHLVGDTNRFSREWIPYLDPDFADEEYVWSGVKSATGKAIEVVFDTAGEESETLTVKGVTRTAVAKVMEIPPPNQDDWARENPLYAAAAYAAAQEASQWAEGLCGHAVKAWNCRADAVRHAYWAALMVRIVGLPAAIAEGAYTAHERTNVEGGGAHNETVMDMENNVKGLALAGTLPGGVDRIAIQDAVRSAADFGDLTVLDELSNPKKRL
jgi:hypothetical protein